MVDTIANETQDKRLPLPNWEVFVVSCAWLGVEVEDHATVHKPKTHKEIPYIRKIRTLRILN